MISLIIGNKGSGKTKQLINLVNKAADSSKGHVVCIEKGSKLKFDISSSARLINTEDYGINGHEAYYGFLSGICAANYDVTDVFADVTFKIIGKDYEKASDFIERVSALSEETHTRFVFTLSCDKSDLPERIFKYAVQI